MDTFSDLQTAVYSDLTSNSDSTLFPLTTVKSAINRAYRKAGGLFKWAELEDAKKTTTQTNQEYYDYPQTWRPDSAWKLTVNAEDYGDPLVFKDYLWEKENNIPSGADYLWSSQWRRYFIYPTPTSAGLEIVIWGLKNVSTLTENTDTTIFSYSMAECNEAIVLEAVAILKAKGEDERSSLFKSSEAKQILATAWQKQKQEKAKFEKTTPFFLVPDFFGAKGTKDIIGNF